MEVAVLLPFLLLLAVIAADWARLLYYTTALEACARNAAMYAANPNSQSKSPYASAAEAGLAEAPDLDPQPTISDPVLSTDADGHQVVTVTASMLFSTITNVPGAPVTQTISRRVQMRVVPLLN